VCDPGGEKGKEAFRKEILYEGPERAAAIKEPKKDRRKFENTGWGGLLEALSKIHVLHH